MPKQLKTHAYCFERGQGLPAESEEAKLRVLQEEVLKAVTYRESLLAQLTQLVQSWPAKRSVKALDGLHSSYPEAVGLLRNLSR
jgi:hypothetical protein